MCGKTARAVRWEGTRNGAVTAMAAGDGRPWETEGMNAGPTAKDRYGASSPPYHDHEDRRRPVRFPYEGSYEWKRASVGAWITAATQHAGLRVPANDLAASEERPRLAADDFDLVPHRF